MSHQIKIDGFAYSERFKRDIRGVMPEVQEAVKAALKLLQANPRAKALRLHPLKGMPKPTVWKIDVFANHSWQVTFELNGSTAELKRIGTHKEIDRDPR